MPKKSTSEDLSSLLAAHEKSGKKEQRLVSRTAESHQMASLESLSKRQTLADKYRVEKRVKVSEAGTVLSSFFVADRSYSVS